MLLFQAETATSCEGSINQAKSSSTLVKHACNLRSDHVCLANVRNGCNSCSKENAISCSCCRARNNGEDISKLQEYSGGDAIDTVPSREREQFVTSDTDRKNEPVKAAERDRFVCVRDSSIFHLGFIYKVVDFIKLINNKYTYRFTINHYI